MRRTIEICSCDICGKETKNLKELSFPVPYIDDRGHKQCNTEQKFDLCEECENKLVEVIQKNFAEVELLQYVGVEVKKVKYKED